MVQTPFKIFRHGQGSSTLGGGSGGYDSFLAEFLLGGSGGPAAPTERVRQSFR